MLPNNYYKILQFLFHKKNIVHTILLIVLSIQFTYSNTLSIIGVVLNSQTHLPIKNVIVTLDEIFTTDTTNNNGEFKIDIREYGTYTLFFRKDGFEPYARNDIYVSGKNNTALEINLIPSILKLGKSVITAKSFYKSPDMATSTKLMTRDEIMRAPGALTDVQRVVQNLPSVTSGGDNVNEVIVRGGKPGENLFIMDNIEIPNPNHFTSHGTGGGVISLINPLFVKKLTFNAGAPPAQYGGKGSSVIDIDLRDGNDKLILGGVDAGIAGAGLYAEGPMWKNSSFIVSAHKSYLDFISNFSSSIAVPKFWGLQGKISQKINYHKLSVNGIYGNNKIVINNCKENLGLDYNVTESGGLIYVGGLNLDSYWTKNFSTNIVISGTGNTYERLTYDEGKDTGFVDNSKENEQTIKLNGSLHLKNNKLTFGVTAKRLYADVDIKEETDDYTNQSIVGYKYGFYTSAIINNFNHLRIIPGIRLDKFSINKTVTLSPRLGLVFSLNEQTDLTYAFGIQNQQPSLFDIVTNDTTRNRPLTATTNIAGFEHFFKKISTKVIVEGFYKQYNNNLFDSLFYGNNLKYDISNKVGYSYGIELFAQKKLTKNIFGSFAYSLSKAQSKDLRQKNTNIWYDGDYDFRQVFTTTGGWKHELTNRVWYQKTQKKLWFRLLSPIMPIANRMEISGKLRVMGGRPFTPKTYDSLNKKWYDDNNIPLNTERFPTYKRFDIRYERRYTFGLLHLIYYFDIQNVFNNKNIWDYVYSDTRGTRTPVYQFPFFPVGGVIIGF